MTNGSSQDMTPEIDTFVIRCQNKKQASNTHTHKGPAVTMSRQVRFNPFWDEPYGGSVGGPNLLISPEEVWRGWKVSIFALHFLAPCGKVESKKSKHKQVILHEGGGPVLSVTCEGSFRMRLNPFLSAERNGRTFRGAWQMSTCDGCLVKLVNWILGRYKQIYTCRIGGF